MNPASPIDSASSWLWWSNCIYVGGAVLTFVAAMLVFVEKRLIAAGKRERAMVVTEIFAVGAAILSFFGTCGAIYFSGQVGHLKDIELATYEKAADIKIATAQGDAATANLNAGTANQNAAKANERAAKAEVGNKKLEIDLANAKNESEKRQTTLEQEQQKTAGAQKEAAEAQLALKKYVDAVARRLGPRGVLDDISAILKKAPPKKIKILYAKEGAGETYLFAAGLQGEISAGGWDVIEGPKAVNMSDFPQARLSADIVVLTSTPQLMFNTPDPSTSDGALWTALNELVSKNLIFGTAFVQDKSIPEDTLVLIVEPKP